MEDSPKFTRKDHILCISVVLILVIFGSILGTIGTSYHYESKEPTDCQKAICGLSRDRDTYKRMWEKSRNNVDEMRDYYRSQAQMFEAALKETCK